MFFCHTPFSEEFPLTIEVPGGIPSGSLPSPYPQPITEIDGRGHLAWSIDTVGTNKSAVEFIYQCSDDKVQLTV